MNSKLAKWWHKIPRSIRNALLTLCVVNGWHFLYEQLPYFFVAYLGGFLSLAALVEFWARKPDYEPALTVYVDDEGWVVERPVIHYWEN